MFWQLALLVAAGLVGPLLAGGRRPLAPVLVGELLAGALIGHTGFNLIDPGAQPLPVFFGLGFAMLMLGAGTEVDLGSTELRSGIARGALAVLVTAAAAIPLGLVIGSGLHLGGLWPLFAVLIAGSSAAVAFPTIQERGLTGSAVALLIGWITVADAITALLLPLTLGSLRTMPIALLGDAIIIVIAGAALLVGERIRSHNAVIEANRRSKHRHWALQLRFAILLMLVLAAVAERTSGSLLVAGFAAGIVLRRLGEPTRLTQQLTGLALGFFVPAFFVLLGAQLDLRALVTDPTAIWLAVAMVLAAVAAHLIAGLIAGRELRVPAGLLASAQLGLPAAAAALGLATHTLRPAIAAALVAGGCLTLVPATVGAALMAGRQGADWSAAGSGAR